MRRIRRRARAGHVAGPGPWALVSGWCSWSRDRRADPGHAIRMTTGGHVPGGATAVLHRERGRRLGRRRSTRTPGADVRRLDALSAVEHRPADVVPQPLVLEYELANRLRELVALPPALELPCALALSCRRGSTRGLDRIGGRTELVCSDVSDDRRLAGSVRGMACCPAQVSGRGHCMAARRASLGHRDLATHPCAGLLDRLTRSRIVRPSRLEPDEDALGARCRPQGEALVIRIGEGPTAADRHQTRVAVLREDHTQQPFCSQPVDALDDARPFILAI